MSRPKRRPVIVTGPASRHKLPSRRGEFVVAPPPPDPNSPVQIRKSDQIEAGPSVRITNPDQSRKELR